MLSVAFALRCFVFLGAAPIPYVEAAIVNLLHPYLISTCTTVLLDIYVLLCCVYLSVSVSHCDVGEKYLSDPLCVHVCNHACFLFVSSDCR